MDDSAETLAVLDRAGRRTAAEAIAVGAVAGELGPKTRQLLRKLSGRPDFYPTEDQKEAGI